MNYCEDCGEFTNRKGFFQYLCTECHEAQDASVESYTSSIDNRLGVNTTWSDISSHKRVSGKVS